MGDTQLAVHASGHCPDRSTFKNQYLRPVRTITYCGQAPGMPILDLSCREPSITFPMGAFAPWRAGLYHRYSRLDSPT